MNKTESANLILKLYDLRREATMRKGRDWFFTFAPKSADDILTTMMDPEVGAYLRMVSSYWEMAAAMVNHEAIDAELFGDTNGEHYLVFAKIEPFLADLREKMQAPDAFKNLEKLIMSTPENTERLRKTQEWLNSLQEQAASQAG
ncbi:MAG: hypothetical protein UZ17_ACD001002065 [Acidobacteria bacterium OLB17]|nr:MAG: hypothetical protein UZ17_ACD001002065 [Acidobacteria bacterium OLB17]MCZ2389906.1 hypothetical protein [Acidobacteriota bacterium]